MMQREAYEMFLHSSYRYQTPNQLGLFGRKFFFDMPYYYLRIRLDYTSVYSEGSELSEP